jgi:hypothetical protein
MPRLALLPFPSSIACELNTLEALDNLWTVVLPRLPSQSRSAWGAAAAVKYVWGSGRVATIVR